MKRRITDQTRSSAAGLGQELNPGKRGTIEEAAREASALAKKAKTQESADMELLKIDSQIDIAEVF